MEYRKRGRALPKHQKKNSRKKKKKSKSASSQAGGPAPDESGHKQQKLTGCKLWDKLGL